MARFNRENLPGGVLYGGVESEDKIDEPALLGVSNGKQKRSLSQPESYKTFI
jgi:hypothetical protein